MNRAQLFSFMKSTPGFGLLYQRVTIFSKLPKHCIGLGRTGGILQIFFSSGCGIAATSAVISSSLSLAAAIVRIPLLIPPGPGARGRIATLPNDKHILINLIKINLYSGCPKSECSDFGALYIKWPKPNDHTNRTN